MRIKRSIRVCGAILSVLALCMLFSSTVQAAGRPPVTGSDRPTSVNANVYLTESMLQPMFQTSINQSIPQMVSGALSSMVKQLPQQDQGWALQMASALLQPSATLVSLKAEPDGLLTTLKISLYQGDPKAITTSVLVGFKVTNTSTIQVTALPLPGGQTSLVSGPLTTFSVPIGSLTSIKATPQCGDSNLGVSLKFPISLGQGGTNPTPTPAGNANFTKTRVSAPARGVPGSHQNQPLVTYATNSYIELPASSLAQLGGSIGNIQVSSSLTAQNIRVSVAGNNLVTTSDILWHGLGVGIAVSTMAPGAVNGNLVVHVTSTDLQIGFLSFPIDSYNQQIEKELNAELNGALTGVFYVNQAAIGPNAHLTCAAANSLVMGGAITAG
ncbi:MAG TPA: hypothetical protein VF458_12945 [Ktedonobacteraceae bacterium]